MAQCLHLDFPGVPGRLVDIGVLQDGGFLIERMARDQGNVLNPHALGIQFGCKRLPERVRYDPFPKA